MYYPYSKVYIKYVLKEVCGNIVFTIIWESLQLLDVIGRCGPNGKGIYSFKTEDGKEYEMVCKGFQTVQLHQPLSVAGTTIKSINLIDEN